MLPMSPVERTERSSIQANQRLSFLYALVYEYNKISATDMSDQDCYFCDTNLAW
jgi:hypothetical protein